MTLLCTEAIVLNRKLYGENRYLTTLLTEDHGLVRVMYTPGPHRLDQGTRVACSFARSLKALPKATLEPLEVFPVMHSPSAHTSSGRIHRLFALLVRALAPHHPYPGLYDAVLTLLNRADSDDFDRAHLVFDLFLLKTLGYGLDLAALSDGEGPSYLCIETGKLTAVPPKEHVAVPAFLKGFSPTPLLVCPEVDDLATFRQAEALTHHMVTTHLCAA
jgi:DNA repair protein RecO